MDVRQRFRGALLGLAAGDALGTTLEFKRPGTFDPIDDIVGGGPFRLEAGQWTDDTSMMLCLAESLIQCETFDLLDQIQRYYRWYDEGHLSSNGQCFDIGGTTQRALLAFSRSKNPLSGLTSESSAGNGSIMRLCPVPLFFAAQPATAITMSGESSRTTHGHQMSVDACRYLGGLIVGSICGATKEELLSDHYEPEEGVWAGAPLAPPVAALASGGYKSKSPAEIRGTGFVVDSLEAALWCFYTTNSFAEGCLKAVNLGDDADTTGAVYGQLAGAFYGESQIPENWRAKLAMKELIEKYADDLLLLSGRK